MASIPATISRDAESDALRDAPRPAPASLACDVVAHASLSAAPDDLARLRRAPGSLGGVPVAPSMLKHADEQTVAALAAVLAAVGAGGLDPSGFGDWAVVVAPRYFGRTAFEVAFPQFLAEGAWGVPPLLIASHSLHAPSGVISQSLKARGPNLGVGGGPDPESDALLAAAVMLHERAAPAAWVVLTGWAPGWDGSRSPGASGRCESLALALAAPSDDWLGPRLRVAPGSIHLETPRSPRPGRLDPSHPLGVLPPWYAGLASSGWHGLGTPTP